MLPWQHPIDMTDFKPLLWPFVLAASVAVSPAESNAADSAIKLPEAVLLECKAQAEASLASLKAKIDVLSPTKQADLIARGR